MSDCSTQAMQPKEPPKTCGNCASAFNGDIPCCVPVIGCEDIREFYRKNGCKYWSKRQEPLEQRYKQLEQVAKDMFRSIVDPLKFANSTGEKYMRDGHYQWTEIFREQLEALGGEPR